MEHGGQKLMEMAVSVNKRSPLQDIDSLTTIAEQLLGTSPPADHQPTAAGMPAPL